ncbi:YeeE/YedE family protein [Ravibacter arvi]|uniref:YeeE/YedE family protein n=1 Tax=Ravibacter arvi TaxID=2051041 RepID=A0ABP8LW71_9BACT
MTDILSAPWPWYIAGPLIGLTVPALLLLGNKPFGISSSLRHICAACFPSNISFFNYNWRDEIWNLLFVFGILIGGYIGGILLANPQDMIIAPDTREILAAGGLNDFSGLLPPQLFGTDHLVSLKSFIFLVVGGFLVGFGTRYAGGCTSGHAIMGLSNLQWPSLVATICFMASGIAATWFLIPAILKLVL